MFHSSLQREPFGVIIIFYMISSAVAQIQQWPANTLATANTYHPPLSGGATRTADKAIDNNAATYWSE